MFGEEIQGVDFADNGPLIPEYTVEDSSIQRGVDNGTE